MSELFNAINQLHRTMDYHVQRHNVLTSNIANVDTPGFKPLELHRVDEDGAAPSLALDAPNPGHIELGGAGSSRARVVESPEQTVQPGLDGNAVSLEREMSKVAANDMRYSVAARLVKKHLTMIRYVTQGR